MYVFKRSPTHRTTGMQPGIYAKSLDPRRDHCGWCIVCCPECTKLMTIGRNHEVDPEGIVTPSLVCPYPGCSFHQSVRLEDWDQKSAYKEQNR